MFGGAGAAGTSLMTAQNTMVNSPVNIFNKSTKAKKPVIRNAKVYADDNASNSLDPEERTGPDSGKCYSKGKSSNESNGPGAHQLDNSAIGSKISSYDAKLAGLFGPSNVETMYRARKATQMSNDPMSYHPAATGYKAPISAQLGYSKTLPLVAMLAALKSPRLAAMITGTGMLGKQMYKMTHPTKQYKDIAYAKGMKKPNLLKALFGGRKFNEASKAFVPQSRMQRILNLG